MLGEIVVGFFQIIGKFFIEVFLEIVLEILIKGPGYFILRKISKAPQDIDGFKVIFLGLLFWIAVGTICFAVYFYTINS